MKAATVNMGRFARVPMHIATAKMSSRAREVWMLISSNGSPEKPEVWVRQPTVAAQLHCSTDTIGRALRELIALGYIVYTGFRHQGRHKIYRISWAPNNVDMELAPTAKMHSNVPHNCGTTLRIDATPPTAQSPTDRPHNCGNLRRVGEQQEHISSEKDREACNVLTVHGARWSTAFACLDGLSGRPSLKECITHALSHSARHRCDDLIIYLEAWLRNASKHWLMPYNREQSAPASDPTLCKEAIARKVTADRERRQRYENYRQTASQVSPPPFMTHVETPESEEERAWIIKRIEKGARSGEVISRENFPIQWSFLKFQWANGRKQLAA